MKVECSAIRIHFCVMSSHDSYGDSIPSGGMVLARFTSRITAEGFMLETMDRYERCGPPLGGGSSWQGKLWIEERTEQ